MVHGPRCVHVVTTVVTSSRLFFFYGFFTLYFCLVYDKKFCGFFEILVGNTMKKKR